ncbi:AAEL010375-PA [Aedes aegypti]|uniref:AAEL010375-PA n=1 Tax=Aedes aegypti TaxID=7159 RepID=Q16T42_AEDAE|nr:AAEL010375-PA [Aedes aegypti]
MLKLSVVIVALFGLSLAYKHHGYVTHVKHIPYKMPEVAEAGQENVQEGETGGAQENDQSVGQEAVITTEDGQQENSSGLDMADMTEGEQTEGQIQSQGANEEQKDDEFEHEYYTYPKYKFEYGVQDFHTGDHKSQWEIRDGDFVKGEYTLADADGTHRIVKYRADDKNGFRAVVRQLGKGFGQQGAQEENEDGQNEIGEKFGYSYSKLRRYH